MAVRKISLRKRGTSFALGDTLYPITDYNFLVNKPSTFTPSAHTHNIYDNEKSGWNPDSSYSLSMNETSRVVTWTPIGTAKYWSNGVEYTLSTGNITVPNTTGLYFIYKRNNTAYVTTTPWDRSIGDVPIAVVVWNATQGKRVLLGYEAHTWTMDWKTHLRLHKEGTIYTGGGALTIIDSTHVKVDPITIMDEDIELTTGVNTGTNQTLDWLVAPVVFRDGANADMEIYTVANETCYRNNGQPKVNTVTGGVWGKEDVANNKYFCYWLLATNDYTDQFMWMPGQVSGDQLPQTLAANDIRTLRRDTMLLQELVIVGRLTMKATVSGYTIEQWDVYDLDGNDTITQVLEEHVHTESEISDLDKYTQAQVDSLLTGKVNTNDSRLSDARSASDVYSWAKAVAKPTYTYSEVGAAADDHVHSSYDRASSQVGGNVIADITITKGIVTGITWQSIASIAGASGLALLTDLDNYYTIAAVDSLLGGKLGTGAKAADSHLLDGLDSSHFINNTHTSHSAPGDLAVGWYTVAANFGDRAIARFGLRDTDSGDHQSIVFYASHHFGSNSDITIWHNSKYSGSPIQKIRIKEGGTYDGALLQIYIDDATNNMVVYLLGDNFQSQGWVLKDWVPDGTDPGTVQNFSSLTNVAAEVDLGIGLGGIQSTGDFVSNGQVLVKTNDSRLTDSRPASDVYSWAKAATKPSYTYSEVGAAASGHNHTGVYAPNSHTHGSFDRASSQVGGNVIADIVVDNGIVTNITWQSLASIASGAGLLTQTDAEVIYATITYVDQEIATRATVGHSHTMSALGGRTSAEITAEIQAAVDALVGGAPGALDTLNELAAALNDDAAFNATITNELALKAPKANPIFTGTATFGAGANLRLSSDSVRAIVASSLSSTDILSLQSMGDVEIILDSNNNDTGKQLVIRANSTSGTVLFSVTEEGVVKVGANEVIVEGDSRLTNSRPASDVYTWAKASVKPSYNAAEVGAMSTSHPANNHTSTHLYMANGDGFYWNDTTNVMYVRKDGTDYELLDRGNFVAGTGASNFVAGNDSRLSDSRPASDVYSWAKAASKPSYTYSEVGAAASGHNHSGVYATASHQHTSFDRAAGAVGGNVIADITITNGIVTALTWQSLASIASGAGLLTLTDAEVTYATITYVDNSLSGKLGVTAKAADSSKLDGLNMTPAADRNNIANEVMTTNASGYALFGWINTTSGNTTNTVTDVYVNTNDGYIRKKTLALFKTELGSFPASDVYSWAKAASKPSYTKSEVGLGNVDNVADVNKYVKGLKETRNSDSIKIWVGTESQYNAIGTKDGNTLYFMT